MELALSRLVLKPLALSPHRAASPSTAAMAMTASSGPGPGLAAPAGRKSQTIPPASVILTCPQAGSAGPLTTSSGYASPDRVGPVAACRRHRTAGPHPPALACPPRSLARTPRPATPSRRPETTVINMNGGRNGSTRQPSHQTPRPSLHPSSKETRQVSGKNVLIVEIGEIDISHETVFQNAVPRVRGTGRASPVPWQADDRVCYRSGHGPPPGYLGPGPGWLATW
jgi:hypothetical protein